MKYFSALTIGILIAAAPPRDEPLEDALAYLKHLEKAEAYLADGKADMAIKRLNSALKIAPPDSVLPRFRVKSKGATAHYLLACAYSMKKDMDKAVESLKAAAENKFTDGELVRKDFRLARLRKDDRYGDILKQFPKKDLTDKYAGKTVKDQRFGMGIVNTRMTNFPKLGENAPDFELPHFDKEGRLKLSSFRGKKPVVLVFGSYT